MERTGKVKGMLETMVLRAIKEANDSLRHQGSLPPTIIVDTGVSVSFCLPSRPIEGEDLKDTISKYVRMAARTFKSSAVALVVEARVALSIPPDGGREAIFPPSLLPDGLQTIVIQAEFQSQGTIMVLPVHWDEHGNLVGFGTWGDADPSYTLASPNIDFERFPGFFSSALPTEEDYEKMRDWFGQPGAAPAWFGFPQEPIKERLRRSSRSGITGDCSG